MSLFNKIEVDPKMVPFIRRAEGVGIVKVKDYGKASARMESYKLILNSYNDKPPVIEAVSAINYLGYNKGNFINEPKLEIGIGEKRYVLAGVDNNDEELESFYETLLNVKNTEKLQKKASRTKSRSKSVPKENKIKEKEQATNKKDETVDLEEKVINSKNKVKSPENKTDKDVNTSEKEFSEKIDRIFNKSKASDEKLDLVEEDVEDFEILGEISEDLTIKDNSKEEVTVEKSVDEPKIEPPKEQVKVNKQPAKKIESTKKSVKKDKPKQSPKDKPKQVPKEKPKQTPKDTPKETVIIEPAEKPAEKPVKKTQPKTTQTKNPATNIVKKEMPKAQKTAKTDITNDDIGTEIDKLKQNMIDDINTMQQDIKPDSQQYVPTVKQVDPVDQIRRYYELKEDGIITEEEFELKKKQLLDL